MKAWLLACRDSLHTWVFWQVRGWPAKWRCIQCCGSGKYCSESMARYGDESYKCDACDGTGWRRRKVWGMLRFNCRVW